MATNIGLINATYLTPGEIVIEAADNDVTGQVILVYINWLIQLGWTSGGSGDGTSYSPTTNLITSASIAATDDAWSRWISPHTNAFGHQMELTIQCISDAGGTARV